VGGAAHPSHHDEPPGFMDVPVFDEGDYDAHAPGIMLDDAVVRSPSPRGRNHKARSVTPLAKRLLRLLLAHPELVSGLGDQQLEILEHGPHLILVRELIALVNMTGARHAGALMQAAEPGSDLESVLVTLTPELLDQEDLPHPQIEWNDALRRIELEAIKAEQSALVEGGLRDDASRKRYQELTRRIALVNSATSHQMR